MCVNQGKTALVLLTGYLAAREKVMFSGFILEGENNSNKTSEKGQGEKSKKEKSEQHVPMNIDFHNKR